MISNQLALHWFVEFEAELLEGAKKNERTYAYIDIITRMHIII